MSPLQRIIHRGIYLLCPILLFLIGAYYLVQLAAPLKWREWMEWNFFYNFKTGSMLATWATWAWAILLMVIPLFLLVLYLQRLWTSNVLVLKTESGQPLKIRETAVNRYIHDRLLAMPYVKSARVRSKAKGGALAMSVRVWIASQQPLNNIQERVLSRLTEDAQAGFGISRILPPDLQFESVQTGREGEMGPEDAETAVSAAEKPFPSYSMEETPVRSETSAEPDRDTTTPSDRWGS